MLLARRMAVKKSIWLSPTRLRYHAASGEANKMILRTPGGPLYFEVVGEGPPLVFLSGWAMSSECWRPVVAILKRRYRCLIYDARGIGRSQPFSNDSRFEIEDHAEDLHSILEATEMFDATLIGHELGSLVAATLADRRPQDARALVLVSPRAAVTENDIKRLAVFTPATIALRDLAAFPLIRNLVAYRFRRAPAPFRETLYDDFANINPRAAYETAVSAVNMESVGRMEELIAESDCPVLIICGEKDKKGIAQSRLLFSRVSAGKFATMKDCGFLPMLEYPRQFARLLDSFVGGAYRKSSQALLRREI
jgi:pimeloyl-ACP methyl ester carboxylesterase